MYLYCWKNKYLHNITCQTKQKKNVLCGLFRCLCVHSICETYVKNWFTQTQRWYFLRHFVIQMSIKKNRLEAVEGGSNQLCWVHVFSYCTDLYFVYFSREQITVKPLHNVLLKVFKVNPESGSTILAWKMSESTAEQVEQKEPRYDVSTN